MSDLTIDRRKLLLGLAAASTAAATATAASAAMPEEDAELLRLGDELPSVESVYMAARKRQNAAKDLCVASCPKIPAGLRYNGEYEHFSDYENVLGSGERVYSKSFIERKMEQSKSKAQKQKWVSLLQKQNEYVNRCWHLHYESGYESLWPITRQASKALIMHVSAIMSRKDKTMEGLLIKAQALATFARMADFDKAWGSTEPAKWPREIARSILRHAGDNRAAA